MSRKFERLLLKPVPEPQKLNVPIGARILHFEFRGGSPCVWCLGDPEAQKETRLYHVVWDDGTVGDIPTNYSYLGTAAYPSGLDKHMHLFEVEQEQVPLVPQVPKVKNKPLSDGHIRLTSGHTFCPEHGPGVQVTQEGNCVTCGALATGPGVDAMFEKKAKDDSGLDLVDLLNQTN